METIGNKLSDDQWEDEIIKAYWRGYREALRVIFESLEWCKERAEAVINDN